MIWVPAFAGMTSYSAFPLRIGTRLQGNWIEKFDHHPRNLDSTGLHATVELS